MSTEIEETLQVPLDVVRRRGFKTRRQWRAAKRKELKAVLAAFEEYRVGCAYTPGYTAGARAMSELLKRMRHTHSAKEWRK